MVTVAKVNGKARTTELDALSDAMEREFKLACADGATAVAKDAVLKGQFAQLARGFERAEHHGNQAGRGGVHFGRGGFGAGFGDARPFHAVHGLHRKPFFRGEGGSAGRLRGA